jgi:hypothetical protein
MAGGGEEHCSLGFKRMHPRGSGLGHTMKGTLLVQTEPGMDYKGKAGVWTERRES